MSIEPEWIRRTVVVDAVEWDKAFDVLLGAACLLSSQLPVELRAWREAKGWSCVEMAERVNGYRQVSGEYEAMRPWTGQLLARSEAGSRELLLWEAGELVDFVRSTS